tara:strand:- start:18936 stop:19232 length:297 start_codon:yes stop_codon:yes gene_type:complete
MRVIPTGDYIAIAPWSPPSTTAEGIHYTPRENPRIGKGIVVGIGPGAMTSRGWIYEHDLKVGDCVLYDKSDGFNVVTGNAMIDVRNIVAVIDESIEIE